MVMCLKGNNLRGTFPRKHSGEILIDILNQVNESILGTCSDLMAAVRQLVQQGAQLQQEIVASGKGGASPKEFYKRNHRWSEGLLSGAKAVAIACQALM